MQRLSKLQEKHMRSDLPEFRPGDTVKVHVRITDDPGKERLQAYQGVVLRRNGADLDATFTVRKVSNGIGVERIFPLHSPIVAKLEVISSANVRQSRLYYLRDLRGKAARLKPRRRHIESTKNG
ncbi:MAG: 50S ribosomal protein L19 [Myxococcales bacterium]|nr:50S ribosomal protein L19 [Myxococcales bacterium]|tara:strand:+ start:279 stop:650 length:372 start_codon:yes stop_codon:yes gene_type:complete